MIRYSKEERGVNKEEQIAWFILRGRVKYSDSRRRKAIRVLKQMLHRLEEEYNSDLDETSRVWYNGNPSNKGD